METLLRFPDLMLQVYAATGEQHIRRIGSGSLPFWLAGNVLDQAGRVALVSFFCLHLLILFCWRDAQLESLQAIILIADLHHQRQCLAPIVSPQRKWSLTISPYCLHFPQAESFSLVSIGWHLVTNNS